MRDLVTTLAYLDPGAGSMILQALLATLLGALFTLKLYWSRLRALVTGRKPKDRIPGTDGDSAGISDGTSGGTSGGGGNGVDQ